MATNKKIDHFINLTKKYFKLYFGIAISVFLFLLFFQPFTADKFEFENRLIFLVGFGVIVLLFLIVSQILFQSTVLGKKAGKRSDSLLVPLYYFVMVSSTVLAFVFYLRYVGQESISFNIVVRIIFICLSLPVTVYLKFKLNSYQSQLKTFMLEERLMKDKLKQFLENNTSKHIEIVSLNESENFRIQVSEIVYVKSADNYVEIGYYDEGSVKKKMLRNTLRKVEEQLSVYNNFIRTHRTSLVNIQFIDKLNKHFNSYWLSLDKTKETVPVSRQYLMAVKDIV